MLTNADCTVYEKATFGRHVLKNVYWNDGRGMTLTKNGAQISDGISVYIYSAEYVPKSGDIIVRGVCPFEFDASTEKTSAESMAVFRRGYPDFAVVKTVNDYAFGGLPHIELTAR